jgi:hypothetical protein
MIATRGPFCRLARRVPATHEPFGAAILAQRLWMLGIFPCRESSSEYQIRTVPLCFWLPYLELILRTLNCLSCTFQK